MKMKLGVGSKSAAEKSDSIDKRKLEPALKKVLYEKVEWQSFGVKFVAGVDEVGRGCLAGPVYAAAVIIDEEFLIDGITDSKLIKPEKRKILSESIKTHALAWAIGISTVDEIDKINIGQASLLAMKRAIEALSIIPRHVVVDGNQKIPAMRLKQSTLIKGDLRCLPISCASIIAKVARDELMEEMEKEYPGFSWGEHKGYGTPKHLELIKVLGPTKIHRRTFSGVREYLV